MKMLLQFSGVLFLCWLVALSGCDRPRDFETSGNVGFSEDSVKFDTLFTTVQSPTERLYIFNNSGAHLRVKSIRVAGGADSDFRLTLEGIVAQEHRDVEMARDDSVYAFFDFRSDARDENVVDHLIVETENEIFEVVLFARVLDAHLLRDTTDNEFELPCDTILDDTEKPYVIDGALYVPENCKLTIGPGVEMYFTARRDANYNFFSRIFVDGTLEINPQGGDTTLLTNFRLTERYQDTPGQWDGIRISRKSRDNIIRNTEIRNGTFGVLMDSLPVAGAAAPKLLIENAKIRNMSFHAILAFGRGDYAAGQPMISANNLLCERSGDVLVGLVQGGAYDFTHCTFYNDREVTFNRSQPAFGFNNFRLNESGTAIEEDFDAQLILENCIVYGTNDNEFSFQITEGREVGASIRRNVLIMSRDNEPILEDPFNGGNLMGVDPRFENAGGGDYTLRDDSPCINAGSTETLRPIPPTDLSGNPRELAAPDIGAYEFVEE